MALNDEQTAELRTFMEDWKRGYDLSWTDLRRKYDEAQHTISSLREIQAVGAEVLRMKIHDETRLFLALNQMMILVNADPIMRASGFAKNARECLAALT